MTVVTAPTTLTAPTTKIVPTAMTVPTTVRDLGPDADGTPARPEAHWVLFPSADGRNRLRMVWEVPFPLAGA